MKADKSDFVKNNDILTNNILRYICFIFLCLIFIVISSCSKKSEFKKPIKEAENLKIEIQKEKFDHSLKDLLLRLDKIIDKAKELEIKLELDDIRERMEEKIAIKIESDISFCSGCYKLSDKGKESLNEIIKQVLEKKDSYTKMFPDSKVFVSINTSCYADAQPFMDTRLIKEVGKDITGIPQREPERSLFLNQCLSELRAKAIGEYIEQTLLKQAPNLQTNMEFIGKGEEIPPWVTPPYLSNDFRRRTCVIVASFPFKQTEIPASDRQN